MGGDRKNWCLTYIADDAVGFRDKLVRLFETCEIEIQYYILGLEKAPTTGKDHVQGYVQFIGPHYLTELKRVFGFEIHWEPQWAKLNSKAANYCKKEKRFVEGGEFVGFDRDFEDLALEYAAGAKSLVDIARQNPRIYLQYGRRFRDMESLLPRKSSISVRKELTTSRHLGPIYAHFDPETMFFYDGHSWVGYHGQETVYWASWPGQMDDPDMALANGLVRNGCEGIRFAPKRLVVVVMGER